MYHGEGQSERKFKVRLHQARLPRRKRGKMTIEKNITQNKAELKLSGWLDTQSSPMLEEALSGLDPGIVSLTLDLTELEYISSAGLRQIVAAYKKMNGELTLKNVPGEIMGVIRMTGLDRRLRFV